jgi:microcystin-dependent protein
MSQPFIGEVRMSGFNFAPRGWATCSGQLLQIAQNQALFALLGTTFGGNGQTTFALPDLRSRTPIHWGAGPGLPNVQLGESAGTETVTLTAQQIPQHTHTPIAASDAPDATSPAGNRWATSGNVIFATTQNAAMGATAIGSSGGSQPHSNIQPYLALNFCIALQGIFPSRN